MVVLTFIFFFFFIFVLSTLGWSLELSLGLRCHVSEALAAMTASFNRRPSIRDRYLFRQCSLSLLISWKGPWALSTILRRSAKQP